MNRNCLFFLVGVIITLEVFPSEGIYYKEHNNILVLCSLVPNTPAYRFILDGIRNELTRKFEDSYTMHVEYLESERYQRGKYPHEQFDQYNKKYRNLKPNLLICVGMDIIRILQLHADPFLKNLPAITIDYDLSPYGIQWDLKQNDHTTIIGMKINVEKVLESALSLFPDTKTIYVISGVSRADTVLTKISRIAVARKGLDNRTKFISGISMDETLMMVRRFSKGSIIIISSFYTDSKGVSYNNPEAIRLVSQAAKVPVFGYSSMGFGDGAIGGYLLDFTKVGILAGQSAVQILQGTDPATIHINEADYSSKYFDWRQLKRFNLENSSLLPKGSVILYKDVTFVGRYKWIIVFIILFLVLQTLLIVRLVVLYRNQKVVTARLVETENKFREIVREDRILITGQLTASLSHELNQPLTAILSLAQAGSRFIDSGKIDPVMLKEIFHDIAGEDKRTASILSSLREMMKLEKRTAEKVNLNTLIEELIAIYRGEAVLLKIRLDIRLPDNQVFVKADSIQIQQVLLNLLRNGSQAMEHINPVNKLLIISAVPGNGYITISVRDHGKGIDPGIHRKLFKPFVTSRKEGLGIGLAISQNIIEKHGGKIWANNMPGGGAEFSFTLKTCSDGK